jgi:hypothetical protein
VELGVAGRDVLREAGVTWPGLVWQAVPVVHQAELPLFFVELLHLPALFQQLVVVVIGHATGRRNDGPLDLVSRLLPCADLDRGLGRDNKLGNRT